MLNENLPGEDKIRQFFVCSYGGCASWVLSSFLEKYGLVHHIHSKYPPPYLSKPVSRKIFHRWFGKGAREHFSPARFHRIKNTAYCTVLYLYVKPIYSIFSQRAFGQRHFKSIGVTQANLKKIVNLSRTDYLQAGVDLIGYEQFFDNYVQSDSKRNYDIIAINVHKLWDNLAQLFELLNIPLADQVLFPLEKKLRCIKEVQQHMHTIYATFNQKIDAMAPIVVIPAKLSSSTSCH